MIYSGFDTACFNQYPLALYVGSIGKDYRKPTGKNKQNKTKTKTLSLKETSYRKPTFFEPKLKDIP